MVGNAHPTSFITWALCITTKGNSVALLTKYLKRGVNLMAMKEKNLYTRYNGTIQMTEFLHFKL
jgi:predicted N-acyltransferase